jgi:hypothetical protein
MHSCDGFASWLDLGFLGLAGLLALGWQLAAKRLGDPVQERRCQQRPIAHHGWRGDGPTVCGSPLPSIPSATL